MTVKELMRRDVMTCTPQSDLTAAAQIMRDHECGFLPVVDARGVVVGVVTDRDVCLAVAAKRNPARSAVHDIMSHPVFACFPDDNAKTVLVTLSKHKVRRLPVVDREHGHLQGVLSLDDVVVAPQRRGSPTSDDIVTALKALYARRVIEPATA